MGRSRRRCARSAPSGCPSPTSGCGPTAESDGDPAIAGSPSGVSRPPLAGLRLLEVTTAWAGPFVGNLLGALGMDVLKFEGLPPFDGYRVLRLHSDSDPARWADLKGDNRWFESSALHSAVNRNKRDVVVDLRARRRSGALPRPRPVGRRRAVQLHGQGAAGARPRLRRPRRRQPAASSSCACRRSAPSVPYSAKAGYGPVIEGMGGFGARFGYADDGARISDLYWPDPVAGTHAALAVLTGIERRDRTGAGCEIDLAHMEVMWNAARRGRRRRRPARHRHRADGQPGAGRGGLGVRGRRRWAVGGVRRPGDDHRGAQASPADPGRTWSPQCGAAGGRPRSSTRSSTPSPTRASPTGSRWSTTR